MKKIYTKLFLLLTLTIPAFAYSAIHNVAVQSSSFNPSTLNVEVGDTIIWSWTGGTHNTTSTNVPAGATSWAAPISSSSPAFAYQVTVAGMYDYACTIHGFTGMIMATDPTGIVNPPSAITFNIYETGASTFNVAYSLNHSSEIKISVIDITGKKVAVLKSDFQSTGEYLHSYNLDDLQQGIYILELLAGNKRLSKRIIID